MRIVEHDPLAITRLFGPGMEDMDFVLFHNKTGRAYNLVCIVIREQDLVPCLVYRSVEDGARWCRPLREFFAADSEGFLKWRWNEKAEKIMGMIHSALKAYDPQKLLQH